MVTLHRRKHLPLSYGVPSDGIVKHSQEQMHDRYYQVPLEIQCFMERLEKELPRGFVVKPWTINRSVTIFRVMALNRLEAVCHVNYESIEDCLVAMLDKTVAWAREFVRIRN